MCCLFVLRMALFLAGMVTAIKDTTADVAATE
jgi:hypothetical protein